MARQSIDYGDIDGAFAKAAHRIKERFRLHKGGGHSIETRGIAVRLDDVDGTLTIYANTQLPHRAKQILVAALGLGEQPNSRGRARRRRRLRHRRPRSIPRSWRCRPPRSCCAAR